MVKMKQMQEELYVQYFIFNIINYINLISITINFRQQEAYASTNMIRVERATPACMCKNSRHSSIDRFQFRYNTICENSITTMPVISQRTLSRPRSLMMITETVIQDKCQNFKQKIAILIKYKFSIITEVM